MSDNQSTIADIESGNGLKPINSQSDNNATTNGLTTENRGQVINGLRTDSFNLNSNNKKK